MKKELIFNIISSLENKYQDGPSFIPISDICASNEEIEFILNEKQIFFSSSKSRFILVHWICEKIRSLYETVNYEPLDMHNEVYEELRKHFNTKAFNKAEYLKLFQCEKKRLLPYDEFEKYETAFIEAYNEVVPNDMKLSTIHHIFVIKKDNNIDLKSELKELLNKSRQEDILYSRAIGLTLDVVGEKFNITRERARQIEMKPKALIERWMDNRHNEIIAATGGNIMVNPEKALKFFNEKEWAIIKYCACSKKKFSNWHYIKELDTICYSKDNKFYNEFLNAIDSSIDNNNTVNQVVQDLIDKGYDFMNENILKTFCENSEYCIYNEKIYAKKLNIGKSILAAAEDAYKDGINIGDKKQLKAFANYLNKTYGLNVKPNRALTARIQDILVMSDKTIYKSAKFIDNMDNVNTMIKEYMDNLPEDRTTYKLMYENMDKDVLAKSGIVSYNGLHGYIKKNEESLGIISLRYYVCKKNTTNLLSKAYFQKMADWLLELGRPATTEEIINHFEGWSKLYPKYAMLYFPEIVQWEKNTFINLNIIKVSDEQKKTFEKLVKKALDNDLKYTNSYMVMKMVEDKDFLANNGIDDESKFFHVLKYTLKDNKEIVFSKPHIVSSELGVEDFTTDDFLDALIGTKSVFSKKYLSDGIKKYYGEKNSSLALALQNTMKKFIRISPDKYFRRARVYLNKTDAATVKKFIEDHLIDGVYLIPDKISQKEYDKLPHMQYGWNSWSICELIKIYFPEYQVLNKRNNIMQNTMVVTTVDSGLDTKEKVLQYILDNNYTGNKDIDSVIRFTRNLGIFSVTFCKKDLMEAVNFEFTN